MSDAPESDHGDSPEVETGTGWFDAETSTFGDRMTGAREAAGLSQSDLAKRLGVKVKTIRAWENDQSEPRANKLQMLSGMLGMSIKWMLTGEGEGLEGPEQPDTLPEDIAALLVEMRRMKVEQSRMAERMGRLEKRMRLALASQT